MDPRYRYEMFRRMIPWTLAAVIVLVSVSSCGPSRAPGSDDGKLCSEYDNEWCYQYLDADGAYHTGHGMLYCYVAQVHTKVSDGEITYRSFFKQDSGWMNEDEVDGRPRVVDIRNVEARDTGRYFGEVGGRLRELDSPIDSAEFDMCMSRMGQETLEQELGGPLKADG